ncbi:hypothetical protein HAX54_024075 [Datura stramonium]|uniref:Uncharacterized protein n=1 Tax=Datura stramonium TaxID=4076 RepID=A0ABS8S547_DATST|nr:hypothetical protein [Datura stramonium]
MLGRKRASPTKSTLRNSPRSRITSKGTECYISVPKDLPIQQCERYDLPRALGGGLHIRLGADQYGFIYHGGVEGRKKRKVDLEEEDNEDQGGSGDGASYSHPSDPFECIKADIAIMKKLRRVLPRPPLDGASLSAVVGGTEALQDAFGSQVQAHVELRDDLEQRRRRGSHGTSCS